MERSLQERYALRLGALHGDEFQAEVVARFSSVVAGFQPVPDRPQGDGGLDGLSHNGRRAYCCYGLEPNATRKDKDRARLIVEKFRDDLRRLCELESQNGVLVHAENRPLATILQPGRRIEHIELVANWFNSHEVIGPLQAALGECVSASQCRFVDPSATLVIKGPDQLANEHAVDEIAITRIEQRGLVQRVQAIASTFVSPSDPSFEDKVRRLKTLVGPPLSDVVDRLAARLRDAWRIALAFEHELDQTLPSHHEALQRAQERILRRVLALRLSPEGQSWMYLHRAQDIADEILRSEFGALYGAFTDDVAAGAIARLIGECTIDWNSTEIGNA